VSGRRDAPEGTAHFKALASALINSPFLVSPLKSQNIIPPSRFDLT
jgi:hypothetical protein